MRSAEIIAGQDYAIAVGDGLPDDAYPVGAQEDVKVMRGCVTTPPANRRVHVRLLVSGRSGWIHNGSRARVRVSEDGLTSTTTRRVLMPWSDYVAERDTARRMQERSQQQATDLEAILRERATALGLHLYSDTMVNGRSTMGTWEWSVEVEIDDNDACRLLSVLTGVPIPDAGLLDALRVSGPVAQALLDAYAARR